MKEVSTNEGRTVLFVSHNMTAIKNLCSSVLYMNNGRINQIGSTDEVITNYLSHNNRNTSMRQFFDTPESAPGNDKIKMKRIEVCPQLHNNSEPITVKTVIKIEFEFWNYIEGASINLSMALFTLMDECVFVAASNVSSNKTGLYSAVCIIPPDLLNDGTYSISMLVIADASLVYNFENMVTFEVNESRQANAWHGKWPGALRPKLDFQLI